MEFKEKNFFFKAAFILKAARVKTFPISLMPIAMAGALAWRLERQFHLHLFLLTALAALFIQAAVNFFNESLEAQDNIDPALRKGPLRAQKKESAAAIQWAGAFSLAGAALLGAPLILRGGIPILLIGGFSILLAYLYTGSRFSLLKTGMSELFCFLFFGPIAVFGSYCLQTLHWRAEALYLGIQCGLWAISLLLVNHLRDEKEDLARGRKHFVTIYGRTGSLFFLCAIQAFLYLFSFLWASAGLAAGIWTFFLFPLSALWLILIGFSPPSKKYNAYMVLGCALYSLFGLVWIFCLLKL